MQLFLDVKQKAFKRVYLYLIEVDGIHFFTFFIPSNRLQMLPLHGVYVGGGGRGRMHKSTIIHIKVFKSFL